MADDGVRQERIEELFHDVLELPEAERAARLRQRAAGDADLEREVAELIRCLGSAPAHLETPAIQPADPVGEQLGSFRIIRQLGEGGMGKVYEAEQTFPRRSVALKVIHAGLASEAMRKRFEFEANALAQLHHPGIAQVYEAGFFATGRSGVLADRLPYFAMELISGVPLDRFAEGLSTGRVLELMAQVADAVQHAHQRGIIHRDLKPGNILVEGEGASARARILDFGVARLVSESGSDRTLVTQAGQIVGTIAYMAPEQVLGADIDTRIDVYALGVILYQLLAGRLPHATGDSSLLEAARQIAEEDAPSLDTVRRDLRGDIATIVAKAMDRDRDRRYSSAAELAADLRRVLSDQPIAARPATPWYLMRTFARRHRGLVASAGIVGALVVASAVGMGVLYLREQEQRRVADAALKRANREMERQKATLSFLVDDAFGAASPDRKGMGLRVVDVLDDASRAVPTRFADDPALRAYMRVQLGNLLSAIAQHDKAVPLLNEALAEAPPDDVATRIGAYYQLGECDVYQGRLDSALANFRRAVELAEQNNGAPARAWNDARLGVGYVLQIQGRLDEAEPLLRELVAQDGSSGAERAEFPIDARLALINCLSQRTGKDADIDRLFTEAVATVRAKHLEDTPTGIDTLHNWAGRLIRTGRASEALPFALQARDSAERIYPPNHVRVAHANSMAGNVLVRAGRNEEGKAAFAKGAAILEAENDETQFVIEQSRGHAVILYSRAQDPVAAREAFAGWLRCRMLVAGADEGEGVARRTREYLDLLAKAGMRPEEREAALDAFVEDCGVRYGPESPRRARLFANLARGLMPLSESRAAQGKLLLDQAEKALPYSERKEEDAAVIRAAREPARPPDGS
ncbi:MAG: protein kinase [Phycisphaerales bacterium]|nr:protein kinase [Phycisphaerales bacterium]